MFSYINKKDTVAHVFYIISSQSIRILESLSQSLPHDPSRSAILIQALNF